MTHPAADPPTPRPEVTIERTKKLPECERGDCRRCPGKLEVKKPVVIVKRGRPNRVAHDRCVALCACECHRG